MNVSVRLSNVPNQVVVWLEGTKRYKVLEFAPTETVDLYHGWKMRGMHFTVSWHEALILAQQELIQDSMGVWLYGNGRRRHSLV